MTLTELRYIVTLAKEQHFGRAAEQCFVSQPTLSIAVKKLEEELGVALFERSKNSVHLTDVGAQVVEQAQKVLQQADAIKDVAQNGKDQLLAPLRVGAIYTIGPYLFPHLVPQVRQLAPNMPLYIEENFTARLREKLRQGELDAIIIALPFEEPDVVTRPLYDEPFVMLLPKQHPWKDQRQIDAASLSSTELLLLGEGHCFRDQVLESCPTLTQAIQQQHRVTEGSSLETIRMMVATGLGASVLPISATDGHYQSDLVITKPFKQPQPTRTVAVAWRASFPRPQAIDVLINAVSLCNVTPH
ncbi:hydrogen peroxide-inducible genes activator [Neptunomonas marina]|uniref:Hydrogen peroxide-inducible genes activator n=1 Tax=Neptunomonas marina TaxID=1815562 RepID=A0A437QAU0_9GAMM|nr:hydrogen peroxide-inducible genes activator [Neptunomonas marina]RVU31664.1 hydrogen peroxide-inducible genes activator [Neptunomonas marina]